MIKVIVTAILKLPLAFKGLGMLFVNFFEVIARFIDDIGYHILHPIRTIRFHEVFSLAIIALTKMLQYTITACIKRAITLNKGDYLYR